MAGKLIIDTIEPDSNLNINGRVGIGTDTPEESLDVAGHIRTVPVAGSWYPSVHGHGSVNTPMIVAFDRERFNTSPDYFTLNENRVIVHKNGYYRVDVNCLVYQQSSADWGHVTLYGDDVILDNDHGELTSIATWVKRTITWMGYLSGGTNMKVEVYHTADTAYYYHGDSTYYTKLDIQKMV